MKHWQETKTVFDALVRLDAQGKRAALAVVNWIEGSAYRRAGAKLLIDEDGRRIGNVSGGCLEDDLREHGLRVIASGVPGRVLYSTGDEDDLLWGLGLGCNGRVDLLVTPFPQVLTPEVCADVHARFAVGRRFGLTYVLGNKAETGSVHVVEDGVPGRAGGVFTEILVPPPVLVVCGAGDDAIPLVRLAADVGFRVRVVDHRRALLSDTRFPSAEELVCARGPEAGARLPAGPGVYAVVMTHFLERDQAWLGYFLKAGARYVGLLGSRARREHLLQALEAEADDRVFGPVGLDLGAEGPGQIAVSVVAELMAVEAGRPPGHLKNLDGAVHGSPSSRLPHGSCFAGGPGV